MEVQELRSLASNGTLTTDCDTYNLLSVHQSAYRLFHSTETTVLSVRTLCDLVRQRTTARYYTSRSVGPQRGF